MHHSAHKTTLQNCTIPVSISLPTFTGKERDEETGYGYFGTRYLDYELMTIWLSVDPMADKYPSISPYAEVKGYHGADKHAVSLKMKVFYWILQIFYGEYYSNPNSVCVFMDEKKNLITDMHLVDSGPWNTIVLI